MGVAFLVAVAVLNVGDAAEDFVTPIVWDDSAKVPFRLPPGALAGMIMVLPIGDMNSVARVPQPAMAKHSSRM